MKDLYYVKEILVHHQSEKWNVYKLVRVFGSQVYVMPPSGKESISTNFFSNSLPETVQSKIDQRCKRKKTFTIGKSLYFNREKFNIPTRSNPYIVNEEAGSVHISEIHGNYEYHLSRKEKINAFQNFACFETKNLAEAK